MSPTLRLSKRDMEDFWLSVVGLGQLPEIGAA